MHLKGSDRLTNALYKSLILTFFLVFFPQQSWCMIVQTLTSSINNVMLQVGNGAVHIVPSDDKTQSIEYRFVRGGEKECVITCNQNEDTLLFSAQARLPDDQYEVEVIVYVNDPKTIKVSLDNGTVSVAQLNSTTDISMKNGSISIEDIAGDTTLKLGNGTITYLSHQLQTSTQMLSIVQGNGTQFLSFPTDAKIEQKFEIPEYAVTVNNPFQNVMGAPYKVSTKLGSGQITFKQL